MYGNAQAQDGTSIYTHTHTHICCICYEYYIRLPNTNPQSGLYSWALSNLQIVLFDFALAQLWLVANNLTHAFYGSLLSCLFLHAALSQAIKNYQKLKKPDSRLHRWRKEALWRCSICPASSCLVWVAENVTSTFRTISDISKHTCDMNNCSPKPTHIWCDSWFSPKFRGSWRYRMLKLILDPCDWRLGMFYQCPAPSSLFVSLLYVAEFIRIHNMVYKIKQTYRLAW